VSVTEAVAYGLAALAMVVLARWLAEVVRVPSAILLAVVGAACAWVPGPNLSLEPDIVLSVVIPPLLYNAALEASLLEIGRFARPIASLSVGLVIVTAFALGAALPLVVGGVGFAAAVALGAAVAPPDPVAALSVGRRVGLPTRLVTVIEGEGLLNDATALTLLQVTAAAATGAGFSMLDASADFLLAAAGGVAIGAAVALLLGSLGFLRSDPLLVNTLSLATPFLCYLVGDRLHVSGVLAVVVAGLIAGHRAARTESSGGRLQSAAVWRLVGFLLEGLVFLLIGQQLPDVLRALRDYDASTIVGATAVTLGVVLLVRPLWLVVSQLLPRRFGFTPRDEDARRFSAAELTVLTWSGTRGVITLAAAYSLPLDLPGRQLLLYCAFVVVAVTLLGQGLTLGPLANRLGVRESGADGIRQRNKARLAAVDAALGRLDELDEVSDSVEEGLRTSLHERERRYRHRLDALNENDDGEQEVSEEYVAAVDARRALIDVQREELVRWRSSGQLTEADLRRLQHELDHQESQLPQS
jgi:CPA1 family monovalent cation:H+ antiporter